MYKINIPFYNFRFKCTTKSEFFQKGENLSALRKHKRSILINLPLSQILHVFFHAKSEIIESLIFKHLQILKFKFKKNRFELKEAVLYSLNF